MSPSGAFRNGSTPTVLLVHGAFADGSIWSGVIPELQGAGIGVLAVANPLRALASDAAYVASIATAIDGPVILVGHSYGERSSRTPEPRRATSRAWCTSPA